MSRAWRQVSRRPWSRLRLAILERDGWTCTIGGPGCTVAATTVDHIVPVSVDVALAMDPANLRAACRSCNLARNRTRRRRLRPDRARLGW